MSSYSRSGSDIIASSSSDVVLIIHPSWTELTSSISYESDFEMHTSFSKTTMNPSSEYSSSSSSEPLSKNTLIIPSSSEHIMDTSSHITHMPDINKLSSTEQIDISRSSYYSSFALDPGNIDDYSSIVVVDATIISPSKILSSTTVYSSSPEISTIENVVPSESIVYSIKSISASTVSTILSNSASLDAIGIPTKSFDIQGVLQLESTKIDSGAFGKYTSFHKYTMHVTDVRRMR